MNMRSLHEEVKRSSDALVRRERSSEDERHVQDLILGTMQEGVLLFDGGGERRSRTPRSSAISAGGPTAVAQLYPPALREMVNGGQRAPSCVDDRTRTHRAHAMAPGNRRPRGRATGSVLLVVTDITETRRIEAVRRDFVANASHELKTPAASIQAVAETLASVAAHDPAAVTRFAASARAGSDATLPHRRRSPRSVATRVRQRPRQPVQARCRWFTTNSTRFEEAAREAGLTFVVEPMRRPAVVSGSMRDLSLWSAT